MTKKINLVGVKRNNWTVIKEGEQILRKGNKINTLICQCGCENGTIRQISRSNFLSGGSKSCGCQRGISLSKAKMKYTESEVEGKIFNNLLAIRYVRTEKEKYRKDIWIFKCLKCGEENEHVLRDIIYGINTSCGRCNLLYKINPNNIIDEWDFDKNIDLNIKEITINSAKAPWWICKKCGHSWKAAVCNRVSRNTGCPKCCCSKGEDKILSFLTLHKIVFEIQKTFNGCKNKAKLRFDFYLPEYNLCIEYQGVQHYKEIEHWGGAESFKKSIIKDEIKVNFCKNNDILLLTIPYWEYDNIEKILENVIYYNTVYP